MTNSLIRKICESRYRWLIVATATGVVAVAMAGPAVDEYFDNRSSRSELSEELVRAQETAQALPLFNERAADVRGKLESLERRTVNDESLATFRSRLVDIVRESGCQIRQIEVGAATRRPWTKGDDPLRESNQAPDKSNVTPFVLERRGVVLAVDGPMPAIHDLLTRLEEVGTLSHPHKVHMQPASTGGETVMLELELWLFAIARAGA